MKQQISFIQPIKTARIIALTYLLIVCIGIILMLLLTNWIGSLDLTDSLYALTKVIIRLIVIPSIICFVLIWLSCIIYNFLAKRIGGIELSFSNQEQDISNDVH